MDGWVVTVTNSECARIAIKCVLCHGIPDVWEKDVSGQAGKAKIKN
jgi:hypothetical protein